MWVFTYSNYSINFNCSHSQVPSALALPRQALEVITAADKLDGTLHRKGVAIGYHNVSTGAHDQTTLRKEQIESSSLTFQKSLRHNNQLTHTAISLWARAGKPATISSYRSFRCVEANLGGRKVQHIRHSSGDRAESLFEAEAVLDCPARFPAKSALVMAPQCLWRDSILRFHSKLTSGYGL